MNYTNRFISYTAANDDFPYTMYNYAAGENIGKIGGEIFDLRVKIQINIATS